ncbi:phage tail protein [Sphingomonas sp. 28-63-12]|uniref:phage tail protein n=1 Tax=Sphingomonas sp. 28-63-12 TaxID=1970434 RepID=UPI000BD9D8A9|nr:MAG: phage tail protein [Sphingomonas sp. 28-63-12]
MSEQFLGEVRMFGGNFAPTGWALCNGQLMSISQNSALFSLIGTTYGGDGVQTFGLPDMRGRLPISQGTGPGLTPRVIGERAGTENVTLLTGNLPAHQHPFNVYNAPATTSTPGPTVLPGVPTGAGKIYTVPTNLPTTTDQYAPGAVTMTGNNQSHTNLMPALCVSFIIALQGIFPSRN